MRNMTLYHNSAGQKRTGTSDRRSLNTFGVGDIQLPPLHAWG